MKKKAFVAGKYTSNYYKGKNLYDSYSPSRINKSFDWDDKKIDVLLEEAVRLLGELNAYSKQIPDVNFFIQMHVIKEATKSSRIEGTRTEIDEVLLPEQEILPENRDDWFEVQNYIKAINYSVKQLEKLPLCMRLLMKTHKILLSGVRGEKKQRGEIRSSQNWIGGSSLNDAFFIPPHHNLVPELLSDLENFWHNSDLNIPSLINVAMTHYQFETIHPFLDGNGRIGRLLITLQLIYYGFLKKPTFYISDFFERNRNSYYDSLSSVRTTNNIEQWIKMFLAGTIETATNGIETFERIVDLRSAYEQKIMTFGRQAKLSQKMLLQMFSTPVISVPIISQRLNVAYNTANSIIKKFIEEDILREITGYSRNRLFLLWEYLSLFKD